MRLHTLLDEIITREIPMAQQERADMKADLKKEYESIQWSPSYLAELKDQNKPVPLKTKVKILSENIYCRIGLSILYLWLIRLVREIKNPNPENKDEDDDDDDAF
jgi:hypothetical protein